LEQYVQPRRGGRAVFVPPVAPLGLERVTTQVPMADAMGYVYFAAPRLAMNLTTPALRHY